MHLAAHAWYGLAWLGFAAGHSALAANGVKAALRPTLGRAYRLAYNSLALGSFAVVAWVGQSQLGSLPAFDRPMALKMVMMAVHLLGWAGLLWCLRYYDGSRLLGIAQLRHPGLPEDEPLRIDGPHRWVRHPLYAFAFLLLWGAAASPLGLATAIWGSLYLIIGSRLEERKLVVLYGQDYVRYRRQVPAFVPWKGRAV